MKSKNQAIVFTGSLSVKSEPKQSSSDLFIVHEGTSVNVLEELNNWVRISLPDGNEWLGAFRRFKALLMSFFSFFSWLLNVLLLQSEK